MNQPSEYGKKRNFRPDFEPFGPNVDPKYFFRGFYFFEMLDIVASYRRIQFQETFFFLSGFSSKALSIHRTAGERGGLSFIPLHHFHPFTNIETFSTLHVRWPSRIFNRNACLPDCYSMRFTTLSNYHSSDWLMMQCLFTWSIDTRFCYSVWHWKPVDLNSHRRLSSLYYKRTD